MPSSSKQSPQHNNEKTIELYLPSGIKHYLTPFSWILGALIICVGIFVTFRSPLDKTADTKGVSTTSVGFENFKLGSIVEKESSFTLYDNEPCEEDGKPVVFMFSATWCPHCQWVGDTFDEWAKKQEDVVVYRYEVDTGDNALTSAKESKIPEEHRKIYEAFNPNQSIPTYVFACQYGRIGNGFEGQNNGLAKEVEEFDLIVNEIL